VNPEPKRRTTMARQRGGNPRRRCPVAGDRLLGICSSLGLASTPLASAGASSAAGIGNAAAPSTASQRRRTMVRARRVALEVKGRGKALVKKARRFTRDARKQLTQKFVNLEQRYDLSRSAVTGAVTSTVINVLCGSLVLGATSLVAAGFSVAISERMRSRRWSSRGASYLGPSGRAFLTEQSAGQQGASDYVHRRQGLASRL